MNSEQRRIHDVVFATRGLGGANRSGPHYWIDDRGENTAGWIENDASKTRRRAVLSAYLTELRRRLRER